MILQAALEVARRVCDDDFDEILNGQDLTATSPDWQFQDIRRFAFVVHPACKTSQGFPFKGDSQFVMDKVGCWQPTYHL
jgi:hypothetical protein